MANCQKTKPQINNYNTNTSNKIQSEVLMYYQRQKMNKTKCERHLVFGKHVFKKKL